MPSTALVIFITALSSFAVHCKPTLSRRNDGDGSFGYKYEVSHYPGSSRMHLNTGKAQSKHREPHHPHRGEKKGGSDYISNAPGPSEYHPYHHEKINKIPVAESSYHPEIIHEPQPEYPSPYDSEAKNIHSDGPVFIGDGQPYKNNLDYPSPVHHSEPIPEERDLGYVHPDRAASQHYPQEEYIDSLLEQKHVNPYISKKHIGQPISQEHINPPVTKGHVTPPVSQDYGNPPISQEYVNPPVSQEYINPPVSQEYGNPPISQEYVNPPVSQEYINPPVSQEYISPPVSHENDNPPVSQEHINPPVSPKYVNSPVSHEYVNPPVSQEYVNPSVTQEHISPPISQKHVNPPVPQEYVNVKAPQEHVHIPHEYVNVKAPQEHDHIPQEYINPQVSQEYINPQVSQKHINPEIVVAPTNVLQQQQHHIDSPVIQEPIKAPISQETIIPEIQQEYIPKPQLTQKHNNPSIKQAYSHPSNPKPLEQVQDPIFDAPVAVSAAVSAEPKYQFIPSGPPYVTNSHTAQIIHPPLPESHSAPSINEPPLSGEIKPASISHAFRLPIPALSSAPARSHADQISSVGHNAHADVSLPVAPVSHSTSLLIPVPVPSDNSDVADILPKSQLDPQSPGSLQNIDHGSVSPVSHSTRLLIPNSIHPENSNVADILPKSQLNPQSPGNLQNHGIPSPVSHSTRLLIPSPIHSKDYDVADILPKSQLDPQAPGSFQKIPEELPPFAPFPHPEGSTPTNGEPLLPPVSHAFRLTLPGISPNLQSIPTSDATFFDSKVPSVNPLDSSSIDIPSAPRVSHAFRLNLSPSIPQKHGVNGPGIEYVSDDEAKSSDSGLLALETSIK